MAERLVARGTWGGLGIEAGRASTAWLRAHPGAAVTAGGAVACVMAAFALYWPRLHDFFVYDDFFFLQAVRNHPLDVVLLRAFTFPRGDPLDPVTPFWRPAIDVYFWALRPLGVHSEPYHAVNFALHGLVGALAVVLLRRLSGSAAAAVATGLLFVVAPTYDFAVSWIAQVSELFAALLIAGAVLAYHTYLTSAEHRRDALAAVWAIALAALLVKESSVILAALLPALTLAVEPERRRRTARETATALAPPLALCGVFFVAMAARNALEEETLVSIGWHMPRNLWDYLSWVVLPYRYGDLILLRDVLAVAFVVAGLASLVLRRRVAAFAFVWTVAALMPFTGFDAGIELRYTYLATLPFVAFVVLLVRDAAGAVPRPLGRPAWALAAAALVVAVAAASLQAVERQTFLSDEAQRVETMLTSVRALCGPVPEGSFVYIVGAPYRDLWHLHTPAAVALYYDGVHAASVPELPALASFIEEKCVLQYEASAGSYVRVE